MAFSYSPKTVTDGLVLYLDSSNVKSYISGSTTWNDLSRNQLTCTLGSGTKYSSASLGGVYFSGSIASIPNSPSINFGTGSFTIELVTYLFNTNHYILDKGAFGSTSGYAVAMQSNLLYFGMQGTVSTNFTLPLTTAGLTANNYYHILISCDRTLQTASFYINGVNKYNANISNQTGSLDSTTPLYVGSQFTPSPNQIRYITRLYNKALSSTEVSQNYNAIKSRFGL